MQPGDNSAPAVVAAQGPRDSESTPTLRVAGIEQFGGAVQTLEVADPRALLDGEVLVDIKAAGVGNWDDAARAGAGGAVMMEL